MNIRWAEHAWEEVGAAAREGAVAVLPCGSTEQHGPMLPLDTDIHIAQRAAEDGARVAGEKHGVRALVLPTLPFGLALHHLDFAGTISLSPETYITLLHEVLTCVVRHGFARIAVISGHGGNMAAIDLAIIRTVHRYRDERKLWVAQFKGHSDPVFARMSREIMEGQPSEGQPGIHAARWETSETLADRPDLVRREKLERARMKVDRIPEWCWLTRELSQTGAFGDPSMATAKLGERTWEAWGEAVGAFIKRLAEQE
jgi:creatinine amidohydrolase